MTDIIFKNYRALSDEQLEGYANEIGLDIEKWKADFVSEAVKKEIQTDMAAARASGAVRGTPTILINGSKFTGKRDVNGFKAAVDAELKVVDGLMKKGVKLEQVYEKRCKGES